MAKAKKQTARGRKQDRARGGRAEIRSQLLQGKEDGPLGIRREDGGQEGRRQPEEGGKEAGPSITRLN